MIGTTRFFRGRRLRPVVLPGVLAIAALPAAGPGRASAQELPAIRTPSSLIPNYDRVRIGQKEGLEGGAYVARTGDPGSNWYNPAGLAESEKSALNASANAYEYTTVELEGLGTKLGSGRFRSVGTFVGGVLGAPVVKGRALRLGFSLSRPVVWSPGPVTGEARFELEGGGSEQITYSTRVDMSTSVPALAAGLRISDDLRLGASAGMAITNIATTQLLTARVTEMGGLARGFRSIYVDGQTWDLQLGAGLQWDAAETVRFGATVTTPGLRVGGSGLVEDQLVLGFAGNESVDLLVRDPEARFDYRQPFRAVGGVAIRLGGFELEADVRHYGSRSDYTLLATDSTVQILVSDADGNVTADRVATPPIVESVRSVTNVALGGNFAISSTFRVHAGVFTDRSPVRNVDSSVFRAVDLTGLSAGISFGGRLSGSLGVSTTWGTTEERDVESPIAGLESRTRISIRSFHLHYALSYSF